MRLEFWLEKDALADIVARATSAWRVDLMVSRGQSSETYCWNAAQYALEGWDERVYTLYDYDKSGRDAAAAIARKLRKYAHGAPITVTPLAVTANQIVEWSLPTRPAKENASEDAVELDAIPPDTLQQLVEDAIKGHIDGNAWRLAQLYEKNEREVLQRMVGGSS